MNISGSSPSKETQIFTQRGARIRQVELSEGQVIPLKVGYKERTSCRTFQLPVLSAVFLTIKAS